jgi:hypothetical protein
MFLSQECDISVMENQTKAIYYLLSWHPGNAYVGIKKELGSYNSLSRFYPLNKTSGPVESG